MKFKIQDICDNRGENMFEYTEYELQKRRHKQELIRNEFETAGKYQIPLIRRYRP